ncbi:MAG TPA: undecaprenyldiphospho-muramoylpentapeptide beta-N-acetylglucosaminyltransferase [Desulfomonilaceae bacterium]|nr:undecaprenyldiphospho-muramoylpentapeptide beta-N-acetylglucosaminyltransferase [Desulfomonilaceae bacterium]
MRLIIAGGGTGGHLFPALAIARALKAEDSTCSILFVGTRHGIEARIVPQTEFPIRFITARGIRRTGLLTTLRSVIEIPLGILQSIRLIREFRPNVVLGVGGYASGPTLMAAVLAGIPTAIQEQNSVMGTTNRILLRFVDRVFTSWEETVPAPPAAKTVLAGNPIREDLLTASQQAGGGDRINILVFGGSRGARSINLAITENLDLLTPLVGKMNLLHQTGHEAIDQVRDCYNKAGIPADVREFIDDMGQAYAWADLVVCRSGASSIAEITALGKPAILVPYPYAVGDHQTRNALVLESGGAARVIRDEDLKNGRLAREILYLAERRDLLDSMAGNSRKLGRPEAARTIARTLIDMERNRN